MARKHDIKGRSKRKLSQFVPLEHYLLNSPAWLSLRPPTRCVYLAICQAYNGTNNGRLAMSGRMAEELVPISRATAIRALKELEVRGFVEPLKKSGFNVKSGIGRASEYRLTVYRCDVTKEPPTKAFMKWRPEIQNTASPERQNGLTTPPGSIKTCPLA